MSCSECGRSDLEDMKLLLNYFDIEGLSKAALKKGTTMRDVKDGDLKGFNNILAKYSKSKEEHVGETPETRALVQQWLRYSLTLRGKFPIPYLFLEEIDRYLSSTTYIAGNLLTIADPVLFLTLLPTMAQLSFYEKEKIPNVSRWFRLLQTDNKLMSGLKAVVFSKTNLYSSTTAQV